MLRLGCLMICAGILSAVGCTSTTSSNTARTATEQMLVSNAIDQSLSKVDFQAFGGRNVFIEEKYLDCTDKNYVVSSVRHRVLMQGAQLVGKPEDADVILEVRSGAVGTNSSNSFLGIPQIQIPGMFSTPEVKLVNRVNQTGMAKIGLVAFDAKSHQVLGDGGMSLAKSADNNWYVLGIGPWQNGSVKKEIERGQPRYASQPWIEVPPQVAFAAPLQAPPASDDEKVRLTSGKKDEPKIEK
jgi:hypothetical protein